MRFETIDGLTQHVSLEGPAGAPVIAFANSLGTDFRIWDAVVDRLSRHQRMKCPRDERDDQVAVGDRGAQRNGIADVERHGPPVRATCDLGFRFFGDDRADREPQQLIDNGEAVIEAVNQARPASAKGIYLEGATLAATMSPGVQLDISSYRK